MELEFIRWLRDQLPGSSEWLGDDAAVLDWRDRNDCVVATDLLADGVHFQLDGDTAARAGRKALAVNLSDLASMSAVPVAAVVSLLLPRRQAAEIARECTRGLCGLAEEMQVLIAGGDTNVWSGSLVINVTVLGSLQGREPWRRSGMRPGDWILSTGALGGSIAGHHLDFTPRVREAIYLAERYRIHAAIDVSDGLALDASRLADESECGMVLEESQIPIAEAAHDLARAPAPDMAAQRSPLEHALHDGEDFELLLAVEAEQAQRILDDPRACRCHCIGRAVSQPGLWLKDLAGDQHPLEPRGYEHG